MFFLTELNLGNSDRPFWGVEGLFSTRDKAEAYVKEQLAYELEPANHWHITEIEIDKGREM